MRRIRQDAEIDQPRPPLDGDAPYLALAREIRDEVARISADPEAGAELLTEAIERWPREARARAAQAAFADLAAERQWQILTSLFDDDELREALERERARRIVDIARTARADVLADTVHEEGSLDLRNLVAGEELTVGLFREADVGDAIPLGAASTTCARRLIVQAMSEPGVLRVISDEFNPRHGLFVTPEYDERAWRSERLTSHGLVRVGSSESSASNTVDAESAQLDTLIFPGGRVDVQIDDRIRVGRLHAGYACLAGVELFTHHRHLLGGGPHENV